MAGCAVCMAPVIHAQIKRSEGDVQAGRRLALLACTGCHVVAPDQRFKPLIIGPPSFNEIANRPNASAAAVREYLASLPVIPKTGQMANPDLTEEELRDVTAFIISLRTKP